MILRRFAGQAADRLLPILRNAGANLLVRVVEQRMPAAADLARTVARQLGAEVSDSASDETVVDAIASIAVNRPDAVANTLREVEASDLERWAAEARKAEEFAALVASEYQSTSALVRLWRPIFSLMAAVTIPAMVVMLYALVWAGTDAELVRSFETVVMIAIPALAGPVGAYIWGRTREKVSGVER